jgi:predicted phosphate transport protein (TIGR00153 family)
VGTHQLEVPVLRLIPREERFFDLFVDDAANVLGGARLLEALLRTYDTVERRAGEIRDVEHRGDEISHDIGHRLEATFVTPFDREDIYRLAVRMDDVIDFIDAAVDLANLYHVGDLPEGVHAQVEVLCKAARLTADAMPELARPGSLDSYWVRVNELENEADQIYRRLLTWLFSGELDPLSVMKLKEIIDQLESAADAFEHVADVVHTIAVKES